MAKRTLLASETIATIERMRCVEGENFADIAEAVDLPKGSIRALCHDRCWHLPHWARSRNVARAALEREERKRAQEAELVS